MAVAVGTAQGKLTLDASKFIANIDSSYKALKKFYDLIDDTKKSLNDLPKSVNVDFNTTGTGSSGLIPGGGGSSPLLPDLTPVDASVKNTTTSVNNLSKALSVGLSASLEGVGALAKVTFDGFLAYTKKIVDFSKDSLQVGLQFDATMSQVSAIAGATGEEFDALRDKAIQMGAETKFSASEAGQAMVYMGMAGWDTTQILDGLSGVMSLAAASGEDLATTSDIVTDSLTAFGLGADQADRFANVLASASVNSNTNVALMGETFKYVAPLAGTLKYSIEDTAVAIGLMANSGIKGSQAGTALRNMITNLITPTKKVEAAMDAFGISMQAEDGHALDLMETMTMLREKLSQIPELTGEEAAALQEASGMINMYNKHYKTFLEGYDTKEAAQEAFEGARQVVTEIGEKYGLAYHELFRMSDYIGASLEQTQAAVASTIAGKYGLSGMLAIVNATDEDFEDLTRQIGYAQINLTGITDAVKNSGVAWEQYAGSADDANKTVDKVIDSMITDLQELGLTGDEAREHLESNFGLSTEDAQAALEALSTEFYKTGGASKEMEDIMMNNLQGSITIFKSTMETFKIRVSDVLKGPANEVVKFGQSAIARMTTALTEGGIPGLIQAVGQIIPEAAAMIVQYIPEILPPLIQGFWTLVNGVIDAIPEALPTLVDAAILLFMGLATGLNNAVKKLLPMLPGIIDTICDGLDENSPEFLDTCIELFLNLILAITKILPRLIKSAAGLIKTIVNTFIDHMDEILEVAIEVLLAIIEGLTDPETITSLISAVIQITGIIIDQFSQVDWLQVADKIFDGLGKGLLGIFQGALGAIDELLGTNFSEWGKEVATFFSNLRQQSFEFGKSIANTLNKTEIELNDLEGTYASTYQGMLEAYSDLVKQGMSAEDALRKAYQDYFSSAEAQYVFRERYAGRFSEGVMADTFGMSGRSNQEIVDWLSKAQTTSGNTYNFYSPKVIDEREAANQIKQVNEETLLGY